MDYKISDVLKLSRSMAIKAFFQRRSHEDKLQSRYCYYTLYAKHPRPKWIDGWKMEWNVEKDVRGFALRWPKQ